MANPSKEKSLLADANNKPLISGQQTNIADLLDNSGGTVVAALPIISGTFVQAEIRNSIASLAAKIVLINAVLEAHGLSADV